MLGISSYKVILPALLASSAWSKFLNVAVFYDNWRVITGYCSLCQEFGSDLGGRIDESTARLLFDSTPSKVVSNEITVSS